MKFTELLDNYLKAKEDYAYSFHPNCDGYDPKYREAAERLLEKSAEELNHYVNHAFTDSFF